MHDENGLVILTMNLSKRTERSQAMSKRAKRNYQGSLNFSPSPHLKITNEYYAKYNRIAQVLNENPQLISAVHQDLEAAYGENKDAALGRDCDYSSETVLRILIVKNIEGLSYRNVVIRIDDSDFLRKFTGVDHDKMVDFTTLCKLFKSIRSETWEKINRVLSRYALKTEQIAGEKLRRDTTVSEVNIHYPTDSSLLWDTYRVLARFINKARDLDPELVGEQRLRPKDVKALYFQINRQAGRKSKGKDALKPLYERLWWQVEKILTWSAQVVETILQTRTEYTAEVDAQLHRLVGKYAEFISWGRQVMDQSQRRVRAGEQVPNNEKLFSVFEPSARLIKKGKAGKPVEFGHVVNLQQVESKFITGYEVFDRTPVEHELVEPTLARHKKLFGNYPEVYADDRGGYESMARIAALEEKVALVAIGKKGRRNQEELERERDPAFKLAQRFRAGIEGSISFLKRVLGLARCMYKGFESFKANVGSAVFSHNLLILARL